MADTPERIWVCSEDKEREWAGEWKPHMGPWTEYIRADVAEAHKKLAVIAAQEAERERCAKVAEGYLGCEAIAAAIRHGSAITHKERRGYAP